MGPFALIAIAVIVLAVVYAFARKALLSLTLALAILAVFVLDFVSIGMVVRSGPSAGFPVYLDLGLLAGPGPLPDPWRWVTFQFVHGSVDHLLLNLLGFVFITPLLEERIGSVRWAILFFAGGAFGALVFLLLHLGAVILLVGASAGLMAVLGGFGRLYPRQRVTLFLPIPGVPAIPVIDLVLAFLVLETVLALLRPVSGIAWEAHVGGIAFGLAIAPPLMRLPLGKGKAPRLSSLEGLKEIATTPELQGILAQAQAADLPELREAWVEKFAKAARCPKCGGALAARGTRLASECGWKSRGG